MCMYMYMYIYYSSIRRSICMRINKKTFSFSLISLTLTRLDPRLLGWVIMYCSSWLMASCLSFQSVAFILLTISRTALESGGGALVGGRTPPGSMSPWPNPPLLDSPDIELRLFLTLGGDWPLPGEDAPAEEYWDTERRVVAFADWESVGGLPKPYNTNGLWVIYACKAISQNQLKIFT